MTAGGAPPYGEQQHDKKRCIRPIVAGELRLRVPEQWGSAADIIEAEQRLADRVRQLIQLCLQHSAEQRPDSERLAAEVARQWQAWRAEAGEAAEQLDKKWAAWHGGVTQAGLAIDAKAGSTQLCHELHRYLARRSN